MKDELLSRIRDEEARLASLERETSEARARIEALRCELAATASVDERTRVEPAISAPSSPAEEGAALPPSLPRTG